MLDIMGNYGRKRAFVVEARAPWKIWGQMPTHDPPNGASDEFFKLKEANAQIVLSGSHLVSIHV